MSLYRVECGFLLQADPGDARLLCALGDLTSDVQHYKTAWLQSKQRSSRAQRSLAKHFMAKSNFKEVCPSQQASVVHLKRWGWEGIKEVQRRVGT